MPRQGTRPHCLSVRLSPLCLFSFDFNRKYRKLEVRYTRLRQGPMRFTFTAEGETLEEEDYPDSDEDDNEENEGKDDAYKMTDKTQLTED